MKISRIVGLALVAMLLIGAAGPVTAGASAQAGSPPLVQAQGCDVEDDDSVETPDADASDTDDVQCGQQEGPEDEAADADALDELTPSYTSSIAADEATYEAMTEAEESAALAGFASIGKEDAKAAALSSNPGATAVDVELENENGYVVYSVELSDGSDVKVDAGTGIILHTEAPGESEG